MIYYPLFTGLVLFDALPFRKRSYLLLIILIIFRSFISIYIPMEFQQFGR